MDVAAVAGICPGAVTVALVALFSFRVDLAAAAVAGLEEEAEDLVVLEAVASAVVAPAEAGNLNLISCGHM